jgi:hypothetical protein
VTAGAYESQTDDAEVLELLAGVEDILGSFAGEVNWKTRKRISYALRALIWQTLMEGEPEAGS